MPCPKSPLEDEGMVRAFFGWRSRSVLVLILIGFLGCWGDGASEVRETHESPSPTESGDAGRRPGAGRGPGEETLEGRLEKKILERTLEARRSQGRAPVAWEDGLAGSARAHSRDMAVRGFWDHVNPDGDGPAERVSAEHRRFVGLVSENIWKGMGYDTAGADELATLIVQSWMKSPGHRRNILKAETTHLGVGIFRRGGEIHATQVFGELWAVIDPPLPSQVRRGGEVLVQATGVDRVSPQRFDLAVGRQSSSPKALGNVILDEVPGLYRLRFYFPQGRGFTIVPGPSIEIGS